MGRFVAEAIAGQVRHQDRAVPGQLHTQGHQVAAGDDHAVHQHHCGSGGARRPTRTDVQPAIADDERAADELRAPANAQSGRIVSAFSSDGPMPMTTGLAARKRLAGPQSRSSD